MHAFLLSTLITCQQWIQEIDRYTTGPAIKNGQWVSIKFRHPVEHAYIGVGEKIFRATFKKTEFLKAHPQVKSVQVNTWSPL